MKIKNDLYYYLNEIELILSFILVIVQVLFKEAIVITNIIVFVQLLIFIPIVIKQEFKYDKAIIWMAILCISILIAIIPIKDKTYFWGNYYSFVISLVVLVINKNIYVEKIDKKLLGFSMILGIILAVSIFNKFYEVYFVKGIGFTQGYKYLFELPYGRSNALAIWNVAVICILYNYRKSIFIKILITLLVISTLVLYSRSGIVILIIMVYLKNRKKWIKNIAVAIMFILGILSMSPEYLNKIILGIGFNISNKVDINTVSSGRIGIYKKIINSINFENLLIGNGLGNVEYGGVKLNAHNIFIQIYSSSGLICLIIFTILIVITFSRLKKGYDPVRRDIYEIFILVFIQSQVEPILFSNYKINIFIWMLIGIAFSKSQIKGDEILRENVKMINYK